MSPLDSSSLEVLNAWPVGTVGYSQDEILIRALNELCLIHGYGRVHQLASDLYNLWEYPSGRVLYERLRERRVSLLLESLSDFGGV